MNIERLSTYSFRSLRDGDRIQRILAAALDAVEPGAAVRRYLQLDGERLHVAGRDYDLRNYERLLVVGAGKAGASMAGAAVDILEGRVAAGAVIVKDGYVSARPPGPIQLLEARHPIPDERGVNATQHIIDLLEGAGQNDLVLCLISGGGSALLLSPYPGISLNDLQQLTRLLLNCGATINEINALRKHLDRVKGGGLARLAAPATIVTLILSDVVGDPLDVIASGPTVPDPTTFTEASQVLQRYGILDQVPEAIRARLLRGLRGEVPETPKSEDALFERVQNIVVGSNILAAQAALKQAQAEGIRPLLLTTYLQGEARQAGRTLAAVARQIAATGQPVQPPACLVIGGETTVTVKGDGLGGRNQEMALSAVQEMAGLEDAVFVTLATDGSDGPTDAAGAVVTGRTLDRALQAGMKPAAYLERNDSYHFFSALGDLLLTGPTLTNVNDLAFLFVF
jgi:hydroxypyruvate reductase